MRTKLAAVLVSRRWRSCCSPACRPHPVRPGDELNEFSAEVGVADEIGALVHPLQQERDRTAGELAAPRPDGGVDRPGSPPR